MSLTDKDFYHLTISIQKACSGSETPIKSKHIRACIISTYQSKSGLAFWSIAIRQPLQENRIVAWKFCHLLHKVLREGHQSVNQHSMRHKNMLIEVGKLWGHLNDGYGLCIKHYTKLLATRLDFFDRNPRFPGNLVLKRGELEQIGNGDINFFFQMAVEMFDFLDDIVALQATIFSSITTFRINSMSVQGQCRLAPLIPLIQDSNQLYDFCVRIMFRLHANLPPDLLTGHRERFRTLFHQLKKFFDQSRALQYFENLISVPRLPETPPNFLLQSDFGNCTALVVVMPEPEPDPVVQDLVDTTPPPEMPARQATPTPAVDFERLLQERDLLIQHLQSEIEKLSTYIKTATVGQREQQARMEEQIANLNAELTSTREEVGNLRIEKEELELKAERAPSLQEKVHVEEERAKATEEKFQKLKAMYADVRDAHVKLLRQHGEVSKQLAESTKKVSEAQQSKEELKTQLEEYQTKRSRAEEQLQKSSETMQREKETIVEECGQLKREINLLQGKTEEIVTEKSAEIAELKINLENISSELSEIRESCEALKAENSRIQIDAQSSITDLTTKLTEKTAELEQLQQTSGVALTEKEGTIETLKAQLHDSDLKFEKLCADVERLTSEKTNAESDLQDLLLQQELMENKLKGAQSRINELEDSLRDTCIHGEAALRALLEACMKSSEDIAVRSISENEMSGAGGTPTYFMMIAEELQGVLTKLALVHENYLNDNSTNVEALARKVILGGHLLASCYVQGMAICNNSSDIEHGERIAEEIKELGAGITNLYKSLHTLSESEAVAQNISDLKVKLEKVTKMIGNLSKKTDSSEAIGDMVEAELAGMDKAIEEAAAKIEELLSKSRAVDSGIKLEVNEKILDACTTLMQFIRQLVQKARLLQAEIVSLGKGTASAKEFYKRNHQWTEGLISAAKSVAQGANFLVTAANKSVSGESKHLELVVAAQEIAASTAQLVVASRVKAQRNSTNLTALGQASKNVTQATGRVVATAKDCNKRLEESQDLDLSGLTLHQAKTKEMEVQVHVLELEQALNMERLKLAALRRKNYQADG